MAKGVIDIALVYSFLKRLVTPFDQWDAYKAGVIDADGKVILPKDKRTTAQDNTWGYYDRLVGNLKKLLEKLPFGKTRLASFAAALLLIRENKIDPDDTKMIAERLSFYLIEAQQYLSEEAPTVTAGSGDVSGIGIGPDGEPGVSPAKTKLYRRTKATKKRNERPEVST
jgi:hypothetical protein